MQEKNTPDLSSFEDIRPYIDAEIPEVTQTLLKDPEVRTILPMIAGNVSYEKLEAQAKSIDSVYAFKTELILPLMHKIIRETTFSINTSGKSKLRPFADQGRKFIFISNHRDIVLDSALLNVVLLENDLGLPRIAIGDNLLIRPWIRSLVRACDAFIVKRAPSIREMLAESLKLSQYIRRTIELSEESIWIAQREGRAKDSDDRTQTALLKMLSMSSDEPLPESLLSLNIVPLAISYEYDPCDYLKAEETLRKKLDPSHKKSQADDLLNMKQGILGNKGRVHFTFNAPLSPDDIETTADMKRQDLLDAVASAIDHKIHLGYRIYPSNYVAYDLLNGSKRFAHLYSEQERLQFELYVHDQIEKIKMPGKDVPFLKHTILTMYANPLINQLKAQKR